MKYKNKAVTDYRLIAGFFREALFYSRPVIIASGAEKTEALIYELSEPNSRHQANRKLLLSLKGAFPLERPSSAEVDFTCAFPHFLATWKATLEHSAQGIFSTSLPAELQISNLRNSPRHVPLGANLGTFSVVIQTAGLHTEAKFTLENFSSGGAGGLLTVTKLIPLNSETSVRGLLRTSTGMISINGKITRYQLIDDIPHLNEAKFRIGVSFGLQSKLARDNSLERRRSSRVEADMNLTVVSPLNPNHGISLEITNASTTGFLAKPADITDLQLLPAGITVSSANSSIQAELVALEDSLLRFQIIDGSSGDRLAWLKDLSRKLHGNVSGTTSTGQEIIDLFCESGAFSSQYLKAQADKAFDFAEQFSKDVPESPWIHRWIERDESGNIKGHISALRLGDNLWHLGDIAGSVELDRKVSKSFIPTFFRSFKEHCLSLSPCPRVVIGWTTGHKYWEGFRGYLASSAASESHTSVEVSYHRFGHEISRDLPGQFEVLQIRPDDYKLIETIRFQGSAWAQSVMAALDFDVDRFGSPMLRDIFIKANIPFAREYFLLRTGSNEALAIFHSFPFGLSPQRTHEVPWLIPMNSSSLSGESLIRLLAEVRKVGIQRGFSFPGVLQLHNPHDLDSLSTKKMLWTFGHPAILKFFDTDE